jgi:hypothetical protein
MKSGDKNQGKSKGIVRKYIDMNKTGVGQIVNADGAKRIAIMGKEVYARLSHKTCPKCGQGMLSPFQLENDPAQRVYLGCAACDYVQLQAVDEHDPEGQRIAESLADTLYRSRTPEEINNAVVNHRNMSRIFYGIAVVTLLYAAYVIFDNRPLHGLVMLSFALCVGANGFKQAYQSWLVRNRQIGKPGAFRAWLRSGEWVI